MARWPSALLSNCGSSSVSFGLFGAGGMPLKPGHIRVVGCCERANHRNIESEWRRRARIEPAVDLGTAIREGKTSSTVMKHAGNIVEQVQRWLIGITRHVSHVVAPIDEVRPLVCENESPARAGRGQV